MISQNFHYLSIRCLHSYYNDHDDPYNMSCQNALDFFFFYAIYNMFSALHFNTHKLYCKKKKKTSISPALAYTQIFLVAQIVIIRNRKRKMFFFVE